MKNNKLFRVIAVMLAAIVLICSTPIVPMDTVVAASTSTSITSNNVYHDQAIYFMSDLEANAGESLTLRLRTETGLLTRATLEVALADGTRYTNVNMTKLSNVFDNTGKYEYWEGTVTVPNTDMMYYRFKISNNTGTTYYYSMANGGYNVVSSSDYACNNDFMTHWFRIKPNFYTPDWAKGALYYSFMPDAFFNGDPTNDDFSSNENYDRPWNLVHAGLADRYGGDFQGVINKLAYIKSLGVNAICYNPITMCDQNAGYGSHDQNQIESTFGNAQKYQQFISASHELGLRLVQDVAIYHSMAASIYYNRYNRWLTEGEGETSPYYTMFKIPLENEWAGFILNGASPVTKSVLWGESESALVRYADKSQGYGVDGYRFDVGGGISGKDENGNTVSNTQVISDIRAHVRSVNPEALLISEWSGESVMIHGAWDGRWDNYARTLFVEYTEGKQTLVGIRDAMAVARNSLLRGQILVSHFQINTHDHGTNDFDSGNKYLMASMKLLQYTCVGSASMYYGEETNFSNRFRKSLDGGGFSYFNWDQSSWNYDVYYFHKALAELKGTHTALKTGAYMELKKPSSSDPMFIFGRFDESGAVVTAINGTTSASTQTINVAKLGVADGDIVTDWFTGRKYTVSNGSISAYVPAGGTILVEGEKKSSYTVGLEATDITSDIFDYGILKLDGNDVTANYLSNGKIYVDENGNKEKSYVTLANVDFSNLSSFTISADFTFDIQSTSKGDQVIGIGVGECLYNKETRIMGGVLRPNLSGAATGGQANTTIVNGIGDSRSKWIEVWGNPAKLSVGQNTVNLKITYENGAIKFFVNGNWCGRDTVVCSLDEYLLKDFKPVFFNYGYAFYLSNIQITGYGKDLNVDTEVSNSGVVTVKRNKNTITSTSDSIKFFNTAVFNNFSYSSYINAANGKAAVMVRDSLDANSAYYAAEIQGTTLTVRARKTIGGTPITVYSGSVGNAKYVKIERSKDNKFSVYTGTASGSTVSYTKVSGADTYISMGMSAYAGVAVLDGKAQFATENVGVLSERVLYDNFNASVTAPLFEGITASNVSLSGGKLTVPAGNTLTTKSTNNDWTFKTKVTYLPTANGDYAGVICKQSDKVFITVARANVGGEQKIIFAKSLAGELVIVASADDQNPTADIILQIQRIGSGYTGVFSYDGNTWYGLGEDVFFNLSDENPGITVVGTTAASFDYVSFGDAVNDGVSYNSPRSPGMQYDISTGANDMTYAIEAVSGEWKHDTEGIHQTAQGFSQVAIPNKKFEDFKIEATVKLEGNTTFAGINFSKSAYNTSCTDGYLVKYTSGNKVVLSFGETVIAEYSPKTALEFARICVETVNNRIVVYFGQDSLPVINEIIDYEGGYASFVSDGPARFNNFNALSTKTDIYATGIVKNYNEAITLYYSNASGTYDTTTSMVSNFRNLAFTDFIFSTTLSMYHGDTSVVGHTGLLLTGYVGANDKTANNVYLRYATDGTLRLCENGVDISSVYTVSGAPTTITLMVVKQNGNIKVFVNESKTPVIEYSENQNRGGVLSFVSLNVVANYNFIKAEELSKIGDYTESEIYKNWISGKMVTQSTDHFDDFEFADITEDYWEYSHYAYWETSNGTLNSTNAESMEYGVTYVEQVYSDFELSFKMMRKSGVKDVGFGGISFRALSPQDKYDQSGITLFFYTHTLNFGGRGQSGSVSHVFNTDTWYDIKVVCIGNTYEVYSNGKLICSKNDDVYSNIYGYIIFRSGQNNVCYDDISIKAIAKEDVVSVGGVYYDSLEDAMSNASGEAVKLETDMNFDSITIKADQNLDLNGHSLYAEYLNSYGNIIDSSEGSGLLKSDYLTINKNNEQLTIYDSLQMGYRLFDAKILTSCKKEQFKVYGKAVLSEEAFDYVEKGDSKVYLVFDVTWSEVGGMQASQRYTATEVMMQQVGEANGTDVVHLTLSGIMPYMGTVTVTAKLVSSTGVEFVASKGYSFIVDPEDDPTTPPEHNFGDNEIYDND